MKFDERFLDELKGRLRLSDVIGRSVKLRRAGREYVGLSPFGKEKSPSFYVNDEKGFFHDFSSGKHGDLIGFLQETERLTFREAVERLAAEAGMSLPTEDPRQAEAERGRQGLMDWMDLAAKWFEAQLKRPAGDAARVYLDKRGLPQDQWSRFRLGFAPSGRTGLKDYLVAKGAEPRALIDAGLLIAPDDGGAPYDRFRDRIIFPITDGRGRVVSFGGRAMDPEARAKYLNGPETALFHKGGLLYGLYEARRLLHVGERNGEAALVVVEGYMDVIACQRAEIAAVAPMGTALTEEQMAVLWRLHPEPTLCFDGDGAGKRAAFRSLDRALPLLQPGRSFRFALVSGGKDPDDVLRDQGAAALRAQLSATRPFVEVLFERERDLEPLDTPERKAGLKNRLKAAAKTIVDKDLAQAYRDDLLARGDALYAKPAGEARAPFAPRPRAKGRWQDRDNIRLPSTPEGQAAARQLANALDPMAAAIAQGALIHPEWMDDQLEALESYGFGDPALNELASEIIRLRLSADTLDSAPLLRHLAERGYGLQLKEVVKAARKSNAPFLAPDQPPAAARNQWSQAFEVLTRMSALESALRTAKADADQGLDAQAFSRLKTERDAIRRAIKSGTFWSEPGWAESVSLS